VQEQPSHPEQPEQPEQPDQPSRPSHPTVARVTAVLRALGARGAVRTLDDSARTAALAAQQLGVTPAQIANSLVFSADGTPLLVLASGGHRVDTAKVADLIGAGRIDRADADFVRTHTGFAIGGVAPVGHPEPLRTLVDTALAQYDEVWAAAGHPHSVFPTTYEELLRLTGGTAADVGLD
jgi:prolyl-tRNA editing enzyme YbaK/EbsC (Cys-tRNA(Pro) deacylase)